MKHNWMKKGLVVSVILLFIGVAIAPSINQSVVKASTDDDLIEVTSQACGVQGYGNTTVKLTREQYQDLESYLVDFRERLNQTSTREEAVPIFKDAVVELDKYGLLPKGLSVEQAQRLVTGGYFYQRFIQIFGRLFNKNQYNSNSNLFCLVAGETDATVFSRHFYILLTLGSILSMWHFWSDYTLLGMLLFIIAGSFAILSISIQNFIDENPLALFDVVCIGVFSPFENITYYASGWLKSFGLLGVKSWDEYFRGNFHALPLIYSAVYMMYQAIWGFTGLKILLDENSLKQSYFGFAMALSIDDTP